jgi:RimJ/RimL family protein N-acetyltransferase
MEELDKFKFVTSMDGEFITLRKVDVEDAEYIYNLRSSESGKYMKCPKDYSIQTQEAWIRSRTDAECNYIIHRNDTSDIIGMIGIYNADWDNGVIEVGRLVLDFEYVNQHTPYGLEALKITYDYVFNTMNFRKMTGVILGRNKRMFSLQTHLGMVQEGYLKDHTILHGKPEDLYIVSLMKEDFPVYASNINDLLNKFRR